MTALLGQRVKYRTSSTRTVPALVTNVVSGDTVNLVGLVDSTTDWPSGPDATIHPANLFSSVAKGTGIGEWQECDVEPGVATESYADSASSLAVTGLASESYVDSAVAAGGDSYCAVPGASASQSLSSGTPRQPSATRPVLVSISGSWSWNLTALGTSTGSLTVKCDSTSTPTTVVRAPAWSRGIGVGISINDTGTMPIEMDILVPAAHYYSVTGAGGATFTVREQVL